MRVCLISTSFPLSPGYPSGQFVYHLARKLAAQGLEVAALVPHAGGALTRETMEGVDVHRVRYFLPAGWQRVAYGPGIPTNLRGNPLLWLQMPFFVAALLSGVARLGRRCDIVHPFWTLAGSAAALSKKLLAKPLVLTVLGSDINLVPERGPFRWATAQVVRRADRVIAVSQALKEGVCRLGPPPDKVAVIPLGVDVEEFAAVPSRADGQGRLLWAGRLSPEKGLAHLLRAMKLVLEEAPSATLTLAGGGPLRGELERLADSLSLGGKVLFAGPRPHSQMPELMAEADIFVLPSLMEGLPAVVPEAMASGVPVVASRVGGLPEVVAEGETGLLVPPGDEEALARAIVGLLHDPSIRQEMGRKARERALRWFTWEAIAEATIEVYRQVLQGVAE